MRAEFSPAAVIEEARSLKGVPWRHQGRSKTGLDCVGLIFVLAARFGIEVEDVTGYSRRALGRGFLEHFERRARRVRIGDVALGDMLVFAETLYPCHVAILSERHGAPHLIHANAQHRAVTEDPFDEGWRAKLRDAFRWPYPELA